MRNFGSVLLVFALAACSGPSSHYGDDSGRDPVTPTQFHLPTAEQVNASDLAFGDAFPNLHFADPVAMAQIGSRMLVVERAGRIWSFDPQPDVTDRTLVLDLSENTIVGKDTGMLALAAHPEWGDDASPNSDYIYVYYAYTEGPVPEDPESSTRHYLRLSRFRMGDDYRADPGSETLLIEQRDRNLLHQGGAMFFGADGFLYLGIGDEGGYNCRYGSCQRIDQALFSGIIRIDVDMRGGDISHPIRQTPSRALTDHYYVPNDNPFVDEPDVLEEFYAIGLRNPYRMSHDPVDNVTFLADVGQEQREEIDVLTAGANYQWDVLEGDIAAESTHDPSLPRLGAWTDPVLTYKRNELKAIIGGLVYRGSQLPSLYGNYLYADFRSGNIWAADYEVVGGEVAILADQIVVETSLAGESGITSFFAGTDGELYFTSLGEQTRIHRVEESPTYDDDIPAQLSQTGLFEDVEELRPAPSLLEYEVNVPLWSDGTRKRRFIAVPDGEQARATTQGAWQLPKGTVLVKHFDLVLDEAEPDRVRRLETRVLVVGRAGVLGATYLWREDQSDADLLLEHLEEDYQVKTRTNGSRTQTHVFPSPRECLRCHHEEAGDALGISTRQLDRELVTDDQRRNQMRALAEAGKLDLGRVDLDDTSPLVALDDKDADVEARVHSYLDANCGFCHGTLDLHDVTWDARIQTPLSDAGLIDAPGRSGHHEGNPLIRPGLPEESELYERVRTTDRARRMPPLGTSRPDEAFGELLRQWIVSLGDD